MGYSLIHLETRCIVVVLDFNPTAATSKSTPRGISYEGLEIRTELKSEWRSNPLPNNTVPGANHIKFLSNVTYIVSESHKDRAWPIFLLFQNLFPLTFCYYCNCCLSLIPSLLWHLLVWLVYVVLLNFCVHYLRGTWQYLLWVWNDQEHYTTPTFLEMAGCMN